jgi:hypothetical protein
MEMTHDQMIEKFSNRKDINGLYWRNGKTVGKDEILKKLKECAVNIKDLEIRAFLFMFLQEEIDKLEKELNILSTDIDEENAKINVKINENEKKLETVINNQT